MCVGVTRIYPVPLGTPFYSVWYLPFPVGLPGSSPPSSPSSSRDDLISPPYLNPNEPSCPVSRTVSFTKGSFWTFPAHSRWSGLLVSVTTSWTSLCCFSLASLEYDLQKLYMVVVFSVLLRYGSPLENEIKLIKLMRTSLSCIVAAK